MKKITITLFILMMTMGLAMAQEEVANQATAAPSEEQASAPVLDIAPTPAQEAAPAESETFTIETVSGEVSGITKKSVSIIYDKDYDNGTEYEILIPVDDKTVFRHKNNLSEIKKGDLVSVEYAEPPLGSKTKIMAKTINFVQSGVGGLVSNSSGTSQP